ncbi:7TM diverse intracellular signaling domain-containing protein [Thiohalobacter sp. IOR34]|uniref:sensor histidine kinase n=1 Tax=Thiohalobacter sp. IOR34 TaxID=3057176 RepID=UPI0025AF5760|nr:ATP-binding protein [Thiohalobacter sp. IOR34]WJW76445.1 7TM diverse intracellular signaling domain-containing protein [Thiohalobacter sp. IOR34]
MALTWQRALLSALLCVAMAPANGGDYFPDPAVTLDQGWFIDTDAGSPPDPSAAGWRRITLPDDWFRNHRDDGFPAWYRFEFEAAPSAIPPSEHWAIYLPAINTNGEIWLNGEKIGDGGRMEGIVARNWHRPLYFPISRGQLREGINHLSVRFQPKRSGFGYLWPIHVGPDSVLQPAWESKLFFKQTLIGVSALLLAAFAIFLAIIWLLRREETLYAWFSAACLAWSFFVFDMYVRHPPFPERLWDTLVFSGVGWMVIFMALFFHRFYGISRPRLERLALILGALGTVALYLSGDRHFHVFSSYVWDNLLIAFSLYLIWVILRQSFRQPTADNWLLSLAASIVMAFGGHDNLTQMGVIGLDHTHLLPYGAPFLVGVLIWTLAKRFTRALREAEALNLELDRRVADKHRQLEAYYARIRQVENEKILAEERGRIMRDMHDGTGGHLVSALALVERDEPDHAVLKETLQEALDDVRLMIDSLDPVDEDLLAVLGMFRSRIDARLRYSGISIEWKVRELPLMPDLGPEKVLQLMRILQEVVTNVVKHSDATVITFRTSLHDGTKGRSACIEICDDGRGMNGMPREGRGIPNMFHRATDIGARLEIDSAPGEGTCVRLFLPLPVPRRNGNGNPRGD